MRRNVHVSSVHERIHIATLDEKNVVGASRVGDRYPRLTEIGNESRKPSESSCTANPVAIRLGAARRRRKPSLSLSFHFLAA